MKLNRLTSARLHIGQQIKIVLQNLSGKLN